MIWGFIQSLLQTLGEAFKLRKPDEVRVKMYEDKREVKQLKARRRFYKRAWDFVKDKSRIARKAKRRGLGGDLKNELEK